MSKRKPQINFQVEPAMKLLYEQARGLGHRVTQFCAAGLLLMIDDPRARIRAINRLRDWLADYEHADAETVRDFVLGAHSAMQRGLRDSPPARRARRPRTKARRDGSGSGR